MRLGLVAGLLAVVLGAAGLIRSTATQSQAGGSGQSAAQPIVVTNAFIRPPAPPNTTAAAYFTVYNTTAQPDTLESVASGAGATAVLHTTIDGVMTAVTGGLQIPAKGSLVLSVGTGHVMIGQLFGPLKAGQTVNLELTFANAGVVEVTAKVIALLAPAPTPTSTGASK
jgi:periplasmic copper chaperone A